MTTEPAPFGPEVIGAWLDGELPADEARRVEAAVAADPALAEEIAALKCSDAALRAAYPVIEPVDDALLARLGLADPVTAPLLSAEVIDFASARAARAKSKPAPRQSTLPGRRLAASIAVVAALGVSISIWNHGQPAAVNDAPYTALSDRTEAPRADALVVVRDGVDTAVVVRAAGGHLVGSRTSAGAWRVAAAPGRGAALIKRLRADDRVVMAEPIDAGSVK